MKSLHTVGLRRLAVVTAGALAFSAMPAHAVDWNGVTGKDVNLFYPAQAAWEWVLTKNDHSGAAKFREGKNCKECHGGEEKDMGPLLVSGKKIEPTPIAGKRGMVPVNVKFAHDGDMLHVRFEWADAGDAGKGTGEHAAKITVMIDDGGIPEAARSGCWSVCHDDATGMTSAGGAERPKYLPRSRAKITRQGGGDALKPAEELAKLKAEGQYFEYWQARVSPGKPAVAVDGHILEKREDNAAPLVQAKATNEGGKWVVELSRKLKAGADFHKDIVAGKTYNIGFALHDSYATKRFHHVSFEHTLVLDQGSADFVAQRR